MADEKSQKRLLDELANAIGEQPLVVGLFVARMAGKLRVPVARVIERLTTLVAELKRPGVNENFTSSTRTQQQAIDELAGLLGENPGVVSVFVARMARKLEVYPLLVIERLGALAWDLQQEAHR